MGVGARNSIDLGVAMNRDVTAAPSVDVTVIVDRCGLDVVRD
tara:strand:+ start:156 stop:281 length:126 start_codon:yes stop_codon:yes gene_type:complete